MWVIRGCRIREVPRGHLAQGPLTGDPLVRTAAIIPTEQISTAEDFPSNTSDGSACDLIHGSIRATRYVTVMSAVLTPDDAQKKG